MKEILAEKKTLEPEDYERTYQPLSGREAAILVVFFGRIYFLSQPAVLPLVSE